MMNVAALAREIGIKADTLNARLRRGIPIERALKGSRLNAGPQSRCLLSEQRKLPHVVIAERALGKPLPPGAQVHHVDRDPTNNAPTNLVICPSDAYHKLLHQRMRAVQATGDPNKRVCKYCHEWSLPSEMTARKSRQHNVIHVHIECERQQLINRRAKREEQSQ